MRWATASLVSCCQNWAVLLVWGSLSTLHCLVSVSVDTGPAKAAGGARVTSTVRVAALAAISLVVCILNIMA